MIIENKRLLMEIAMSGDSYDQERIRECLKL